MDCRNCQPTLIDLLYGELATDAAEDARAHLRDCASCRAAYDKLAGGLRVARTLELVEPPPGVEHNLLELAQARAHAIAEQRAAAAPPPLSPMRLAVDFVRRLAMARQANMVAVSLLVAAVVLLALPQLLRAPAEMSPVPTSVQVTPQPAEEPAPADGVKPAERLGLKMDSHSGRIRPAEDESAALTPAAEPAAAMQVAESAARDEKKGVAPHASAAHAYRSRGDLVYAKGEPLVKDKQQQAQSIDDLLDGASVSRPAAAPAPNPFPSNEGALAREAAPQKAARAEASRDKAATSSVGTASGSGAASTQLLNPFRSSPAAAPPPAAAPAQMANIPAAKPAARPAPTPLAAQLQAARAIAQRDGCAVALGRYQQLVASGGGTIEAGEALLDMAHCRISLGQPALARGLLERAAQIPAVAPRARAMLAEDSDMAPQAGPPAAGPGR